MPVKIENRVGIQAPIDTIWDLIFDLPSWADWNPMYARAEGKIAIGGTLSLTETIAGATRELEVRVLDWVPREQLHWLDNRAWLSRSVRFFEIEQLEPGRCIVGNGELFAGWRGERWAKRNRRLLKDAYEAVNEALRARAEAQVGG